MTFSPSKQSHEGKDLDDLDLGGFSRYQLYVCLAAAFLFATAGCGSQIYVYLDALPEFRCAVPPLENPKFNLTEDQIRNYTIPFNKEKNTYESCKRYNIDLSSCIDDLSCIVPTDEVISCDYGYHYETDVYAKTADSEWDIVCDNRYLDAITDSLFFVGFFLGSAMSGPVNDWFGRKLALYIFSFGYVVAETGLSYAPNYTVYVLFRIFVAMFYISTFISGITYVSEMSAKKYKTYGIMAMFVFASISHTIVPLLAYLYRDWRYLEFYSGLLPIPFVLFYKFLPESPRWLLAKDQPDKARAVVEKYAKSNKTILNDDDWNEVVETEKRKRSEVKSSKKYSVVDLFRTPRIRVISLTIMFAWFTVNVLFYGLILNVGHLAGDPFLNGFLLSSVEIVGCFLALLAPWTGKKKLLSGFYLMSGVACLLSTVIKQLFISESADVIVVTLALVGKLGAGTCFCLVYSVTSDVYPTIVRATGLSLGSMSARVGGMITPFTVQLQTVIPWLTQAVFGTLGVITFFTCLILPETENCDCLTTLEEAEVFYEQNMSNLKNIKYSMLQNQDGEEEVLLDSFDHDHSESSEL